MCGIAGVIYKSDQTVDTAKLTLMRDTMIHRGPDAGGIWIDKNVGLAHRRLSIIDLSPTSNQPFISPCGNYILIYNGEVFNYKEFKPELIAKGYIFKTESDTEVLLYLLMEYGTKVLNSLIGFWAFALWNKKEERLLLVRDRMGVKPLFFAEQSGYFSFASEPKALFAGGVEKMIAEEYLDELFFYRHVSGEDTIFKNVMRVLPGHFMEIDRKGKIINASRWFHLGEEAKAHAEIKNPLEWFEETFYSSIQYRMIADVPIGTMLSGGIDSSAVLFAQQKMGYQNISSWNIGFKGFKDDESTISSNFSQKLNIPFYTHEFKGEELDNLIKESIHISDEPFMHMQEPLLLGLCKKAKEKVTVLQSGEASDELLGGYVRYKVQDNNLRYNMLKMLKFVPDKFINDQRWKKMKKYISSDNRDFQLITNANNIFKSDLEHYGFKEYSYTSNYRNDILAEAKQFYPKNALRQLLYLEQFTHLPSLNDRNDRVSMGASIENREPFEDHRLYSGVFSLPDRYFTTKGKGKWLLMNSIGKKLPEEITNHRKIGLSIPWFDHFENSDYFKENMQTMHLSPIFQTKCFEGIDIKKLSDENVKYGNSKSIFFKMLFLHTWYKEYFEQ